MSQGFRNLQVWQRSKALAVAVYRLTETPPFARVIRGLIKHRQT